MTAAREPIDGPHAFKPHWSHECAAWVVHNGENDQCCARPDDPIHRHCLTFDALRALGDVTEVFDDEPGGAR